MNEYSELTKNKIQLYFASNYLFEHGKSHPQVVEILSDYEPNTDLLVDIVDQAMQDKWRKIYNEAQRLFSENKTYQEVFDLVSQGESDHEIVHFICDSWYRVKTFYVENLVESRTNILEGIQWVIICTLGVVAVFYFKTFWVSKIVWIAGLVAALITWIYGLQQKKLANGVKKILEEDYSKLERLI